MFSEEDCRRWGFHPMQNAFFLTAHADNASVRPARVSSQGQDHQWVRPLSQEVELKARPRGSLREQGHSFVVGDWVLVDFSHLDQNFYPIVELLPRRTELKRSHPTKGFESLVANVDVVAIVTSFNLDFNLNRIERALVMIMESGARPMIIINKKDSASSEQVDSIFQDAQMRWPTLKIIATSALTGDGLKEVATHMGEGETLTLLGMSGVGKSTLVNALMNSKIQKTQNIREDDARGRHTTTSRDLLLSPQGFWIVDTPGIREFSFFGDETDLDESFQDIAELSELCRFRDCAHSNEPGCAIQSALLEGLLDGDRWRNFLKLQREMQFHLKKHDKAWHSQQKQVRVARARALKARYKLKAKNHHK